MVIHSLIKMELFLKNFDACFCDYICCCFYSDD